MARLISAIVYVKGHMEKLTSRPSKHQILNPKNRSSKNEKDYEIFP
jgi:hypothetical protein